MGSYAVSTQKAAWTWTEDECAAKRTASRNLVAARCPAILTSDEERRLRHYYERSIMILSSALGYPTKVMATAVVVFKRAHLTRSLMEYNPVVSILCAVYAASKIEEHLRSAHEIVDVAKRPNSELVRDGILDFEPVTADTVLSYEIKFLSMLRFHLVCFHPYRSLDAVAAALRQACNGEEGTGKPLDKLARAANKVVTRRILLSDLVLSYSPGVLAFVAFATAAQEAGMNHSQHDNPWDFEKLTLQLASESSHQGDGQDAWTTIKRVAHALSEMASEAETSNDQLRQLELRRRQLVDPDLDPTSDEYKKRQSDLQDAKESKRIAEAKAAAEKLRKEREDILGAPWQGGRDSKRFKATG